MLSVRTRGVFSLRRVSMMIFIGYLLLGILVHRDYGISFDEHITRGYGVISWDYVTRGDTTLFDYQDRQYGVGIELPLYALERALGVQDSRSIYFFRHLATFFLFSAAVFVFYRTLRVQYGDLLGSLGALFLVLHPRMFADSFYNSKDIGLLSAFVFAFAVLTAFLRRRTIPWTVLFGFITAWVVTVRIFGFFLVPIAFVSLWIAWYTKQPGMTAKQFVKLFAVYCLSVSIFAVALWPYLWSNPVQHFLDVVHAMSKFDWPGQVLYLGEYMDALNPPWHYPVVWILISTPVLYVILFGLGLLSFVSRLFRQGLKALATQGTEIIFILWFFLPLLATFILQPTLYDGWRHFFFLYPAFVGIGIAGIAWLRESLTRSSFNPHLVSTVTGVALLVSLIGPISFMIRYHPYQNLYFNLFAGGMEHAKKHFELDYWGLTFREGLEYIAKVDPSSYIPVHFTFGSPNNPLIVSARDRERFEVVQDIKRAKYLLTNYRGHPDDYSYPEVYSVKIDGVRVMTVYKVR